MSEFILIFAVLVAVTSATMAFKHVENYRKLFSSLNARDLAKDSWAPSFLIGGSSWGYRFKLKDIESSLSCQLNQEERDLIQRSRKAQSSAIIVMIVGLAVVALIVLLWLDLIEKIPLSQYLSSSHAVFSGICSIYLNGSSHS